MRSIYALMGLACLLIASLFMIGCESLSKPVAEADLANMTKLVGRWQDTDTEHHQTDLAHYELVLQGNVIVVYIVWDKDSLIRNKIKGDRYRIKRFSLEGRRLYGETDIGRKWLPDPSISGIVDEDFRTIHFREPMAGVKDSFGNQAYENETIQKEDL